VSAIKTSVPTGTWVADKAHSRVEFAIKHMGIATVRGSFGDFAGTLEIGENGARAFGTVEVASITTGEEARDNHLRSADFFDAENIPQIQFESTSIEALDDEEFRITGNLTMHGITKEIVLHAEYQGTDIDPWGGTRIGLEVTGQINRSDWDMKFNQMLGSGNMMVADKVKLEIDISAVKQEG
jgi:polyisoprenoid-binding protein YceI